MRRALWRGLSQRHGGDDPDAGAKAAMLDSNGPSATCTPAVLKLGDHAPRITIEPSNQGPRRESDPDRRGPPPGPLMKQLNDMNARRQYLVLLRRKKTFALRTRGCCHARVGSRGSDELHRHAARSMVGVIMAHPFQHSSSLALGRAEPRKTAAGPRF